MSTMRLAAQGNIPTPAPSPPLKSYDSESVPQSTPPSTLLSPPPPPSHVELYERKPLPPIPAASSRRHSQVSMLSREMSNAFETPQSSIDLGLQPPDHLDAHIDWKKEEADIALVLEERVKANASLPPVPPVPVARRRRAGKKSKRKVETGAGIIPINTPSDDLVSPQPKSSVQKILRLTGVRPIMSNASSPSPSGHDSPRKVAQITGMRAAPANPRRPPRPTGKGVDVEDSPVSNRSSVYSQDSDTAPPHENSLAGPPSFDVGYGDKGYASDPGSGYFARRAIPRNPIPGTVPEPLRLTGASRSRNGVRDTKHGAYPKPATFASVDLTRAGGVNDNSLSRLPQDVNKYGQDLYQATAAQLAQSVPSAPPHRLPPPRPPRAGFVGDNTLPPPPKGSVPRWMTLVNDDGAVSIPPPYPISSQYSASPDTMAGLANGETAFRAASTDTFGHRRYLRQLDPYARHSPSPGPSRSPSPGPSPGQMTHKHNSDSNITVLKGSGNDNDNNNGNGNGNGSSNTDNNHGRTPRSIMSKVFSRSSGSAPPTHRKTASSPPPPAPAPTPPPVPSPLLASPYPPYSTSALQHSFAHDHPKKRWMHRPTQSAGAAVGASPALLSPRSPPFRLPAAMQSMGSLGDAVEHARTAAGLWTRAERAERRRETLKGKIVVLADGGQVLGDGKAEEGKGVSGGVGVGTVGTVGTAVTEPGVGMLQGDGPWL